MNNLIKFYTEKLDAPDTLLEIPLAKGGPVEVISAAIMNANPAKGLHETGIITLGLSAFNKGKNKFELSIEVKGVLNEAELTALIQSFLKLLPANGRRGDGDMVKEAGLALFKENNISSILYANRGLMDEDYLDEAKNAIKLLEIVPLSETEFETLAGENSADRGGIVLCAAIPYRDPARAVEKYPVSQAAVFNIWQKILSWYKEHAVGQYNTISQALSNDAPPARLNFLPEEVIWGLAPSFYASYTVLNHEVHVNSYSLFNLERMQQVYEGMNGFLKDGTFDEYHVNVFENDKIIKKWWSPLWVPFAMNSSGDLLCIDLSPGKKGTKGQIINFLRDQGPFETEYHSFFHWLLSYKNDLFYLRYQVTESGMIEGVS